MQTTEAAKNFKAEDRHQEETPLQAATLHKGSDGLAEVAHDARNMVTALGLYCDLLQEPGVLTVPFCHYGHELRLLAAASRKLVEKLVLLDTCSLAPAPAIQHRRAPKALARLDALATQSFGDIGDPVPSALIENFAAEIQANRNLLAAIAGPSITVTVRTDGGACPVPLTGEDLTRILVNMVRNATEAMPCGGTIQLSLTEMTSSTTAPQRLSLTISDDGPGISEEAGEKIFDAGYSTHAPSVSDASWPAMHRGLGLSITRSILEAVGGSIEAARLGQGGAHFVLELPVRPI